MKLNLEQVKSITTGAVNVAEENRIFHFYRFTEVQTDLYKKTSRDFYEKSFSSAGIRLSFKTDSNKLFLNVVTSEGSSRKYFSFDVFVNGKFVGCLDNFSEAELPKDYTKLEFDLGEFSKEFILGDGVKNVCIYFPWSTRSLVKEISVDDGSFVEPVKAKKKLLAFGDSITQGYDAKRPSNRYVSILADKLGAEEFNKGIGGEVFIPALAKMAEDFVPDYITVAYGTNDWSKKTEGDFEVNCREFYVSLSKNYPNSKIFAITPIWRKDYLDERECGLFANIEKKIVEATADLENVTVIPGFDFIPKDEKYFADLRLHPNDEGFSYYADSLYKEIIKILDGKYV